MLEYKSLIQGQSAELIEQAEAYDAASKILIEFTASENMPVLHEFDLYAVMSSGEEEKLVIDTW